MKDLFPGFYTPTEPELNDLWQNAIFAFDTSSILELYRTSTSTRDTYLKVLRHFKDRLWLPHQSAYEFHANRPFVIEGQKQKYKNVFQLKGGIQTFQSTLEQHKHHPMLNFKGLQSALNKFKQEINDSFDEQADLESYETRCLEDDKELIELFQGRIGTELENIDAVRKSVQKRYEQKKPPGYHDAKKNSKNVDRPGGDPFGDGIIWFELLQKAAVCKDVIFIINDKKPDWWLLDSNKMIIAPRPELRQEMQAAGAKFYMYTTENFIKHGAKYLPKADQPSEEDIANAVEEITEQRSDNDIENLLNDPNLKMLLLNGEIVYPNSIQGTFDYCKDTRLRFHSALEQMAKQRNISLPAYFDQELLLTELVRARCLTQVDRGQLDDLLNFLNTQIFHPEAWQAGQFMDVHQRAIQCEAIINRARIMP